MLQTTSGAAVLVLRSRIAMYIHTLYNEPKPRRHNNHVQHRGRPDQGDMLTGLWEGSSSKVLMLQTHNGDFEVDSY